jgi:hypothetical protein
VENLPSTNNLVSHALFTGVAHTSLTHAFYVSSPNHRVGAYFVNGMHYRSVLSTLCLLPNNNSDFF